MSKKYLLLDSGDQEKLEAVGPFRFIRPAPLALWPKRLSQEEWQKADAVFSRKEKSGWSFKKRLPDSWKMEINQLLLKATPTSFGHFGFFPEHFDLWEKLASQVQSGMSILNLFAYTGAATLFFAKKGASLCHLDASKTSVAWARENAALNHLEKAPIRWIVDDVFKFLKREVKRGVLYDGILLDPPSFGRGSKLEVFKIEKAIGPLLTLLEQLLSPKACFLAFSCHTPGFTPALLKNLLTPLVQKRGGQISTGELTVTAQDSWNLPAGVYAIWEKPVSEKKPSEKTC